MKKFFTLLLLVLLPASFFFLNRKATHLKDTNRDTQTKNLSQRVDGLENSFKTLVSALQNTERNFSDTALKARENNKELRPEFFIPNNGEVIVQKNETLEELSLRLYGDKKHWKDILAANSSINDPNLIFYGEILKLPENLVLQQTSTRGIASTHKTTSDKTPPNLLETSISDIQDTEASFILSGSCALYGSEMLVQINEHSKSTKCVDGNWSFNLKKSSQLKKSIDVVLTYKDPLFSSLKVMTVLDLPAPKEN